MILVTIIKDRSGYAVKVTRLLGHFLDYGFRIVFSCNSAKTVTENSTGLVGIGLSGSKLLLISFSYHSAKTVTQNSTGLVGIGLSGSKLLLISFSYHSAKTDTEFNRVSGDWSVRGKAASDLFNLMYKKNH